MLVVAYDVADDRRRARLHTLLLGYGTSVQESLFECELSAPEERELRRRVAALLRPRADRVNYYRLCVHCAANAADLRGPRAAAPDVVVI